MTQTTSSLQSALTDYLVLQSLSFLPSLTTESSDADDSQLQNALKHYIKQGMISGKSGSGHHLMSMVASLEDIAPELNTPEEAFEALPALLAEDEHTAYALEEISYALANVAQTGFESLAVLSQTADDIVKNVDEAGREGNMLTLTPETWSIDTIDLGVADDDDAIQDALQFAADFFGEGQAKRLLEAHPTTFLEKGRNKDYKALRDSHAETVHRALDEISLDCPREEIHRLLMSSTYKGSLFSPAALQDKDAFLAGSLDTQAVWKTLNSILEAEENDNISDVVIEQARRVRNIVALAVLYYHRLLEMIYKNMLIFNYNKDTIFVSPIGYQIAEGQCDDIDDVLKEFVALKYYRGIETPACGFSVKTVLESQDRTTEERRQIESDALKKSDENRVMAERQFIDQTLRSMINDGKIELLNDRARIAYRNALKNDDNLSDHVMEYLVHATNHPVLSVYHDATLEAHRSNEDLADSRAQGTFNAVGRILLGAFMR